MQVASAPAKAILSGDHSAVYGCPALVMALEQRLSVRYYPDTLPRLSWLGPDKVHEMALEKFSSLRHRLDNAFEAYLKGERSITEILSRPAELVFYTVEMAHLLGEIKQLPRGKVEISSDIPIGAGMGSSAALLAALLTLFAKAENSDDLIRQVRHCERLQHGRGSLMDAAAVTLGGLVKLENERAERVSFVPTEFDANWYWIHTGTPEVSTGTCVDQVRRNFANSSIWSEFTAVTEAMHSRLAQQQSIADLISQNHRLLNRIGVVPAHVAALIERVEERGGAAKVSGAGTVVGNAAGLVIAYLPQHTPAALNLPRHYRWGELRISNRGACRDE